MVQILTDSSADLELHELKELNVGIRNDESLFYSSYSYLFRFTK